VKFAYVTAWCLVLATSERAAGQGYGVYEQSACAMARGGAAVSAPCDDGSAVFFNPAALAMQRDGSRLSAGATLIGPRGDFTGFDGRVTGRRLTVDVAYQFIDQDDRAGRVLLRGPDTGTYAFHANLFAATIVTRF
jgi:long-subunit fatty acid transport protein